MKIQVRIRDISFAEMAAAHGLSAADVNPEYRDEWEKRRGQLVTIVTPQLPADQDCRAGGRVWLTPGSLWRSMCEHQLEIGD